MSKQIYLLERTLSYNKVNFITKIVYTTNFLHGDNVYEFGMKYDK